MALRTTLRDVVLEELRTVNVLLLRIYAEENHAALSALCDCGVLDDSSIEDALHVAVLAQARKDFELLINPNRQYLGLRADHVPSPEGLAYAIEKDAFSSAELSQIPFDHGFNAHTFSSMYHPGSYLSTLRSELLGQDSRRVPDI